MSITKTSLFNHEQYKNLFPDHVDCHYLTIAKHWIIKNVLIQSSLSYCKILDVGCGRGFVVRYLRRQGFDCFGVEPSHVSVVRGAEEYVKTGVFVENLDNEDAKRYNVVLLLDVIEHIQDPIRFLRDNIVAKFPNLTHIVFVVPAGPELWSNFDVDYGHYRRYTIGMMNEIARELDFTLIYRGYLWRLLYWPLRVFIFLHKKRELRHVPPRGGMKIFHYIFSKVLIADHCFLPKKLKGGGLICCYLV